MQRRVISHQGRQRRYLLLNEDADHDDLVLFFHGSLQSGSVIRRFTAGTFDRLPATVVYPDGYRNHFNDARAILPVEARTEGIDDVGFTQAIVDELRPRRVFACGYSNGGQFVLRLLFDAPSLLAGAAVFASTLGAGDNHATTNPFSAYLPTPVLLMHGTADWLAPYEGGVAGIDKQRTRGPVLSARANAARLAELNGAAHPTRTQPYPDTTVDRWQGQAPVELWTVHDMGHVIPSGNDVDARLGRTTDSFIAADVVSDFFDLSA